MTTLESLIPKEPRQTNIPIPRLPDSSIPGIPESQNPNIPSVDFLTPLVSHFPMHFRLLLPFALVTFSTALSVLHAAPLVDWPQWRGPGRDDLSKETGLLKEWPAGGPKPLVYKMRAGYAGFSVVGGKLFTMGTPDGTEVLFAPRCGPGKSLGAKLGEVHSKTLGDGPRGTPNHRFVIAFTRWAATARCLRKPPMASKRGGGRARSRRQTAGMGLHGKRSRGRQTGGLHARRQSGAIAALDKMTGAPLWQSGLHGGRSTPRSS
jgi:hypothetical protein